jgi:hypothetical protein
MRLGGTHRRQHIVGAKLSKYKHPSSLGRSLATHHPGHRHDPGVVLVAKQRYPRIPLSSTPTMITGSFHMLPTAWSELIHKLASGAPYRLLRHELPRGHAARKLGRSGDLLVLDEGDQLWRSR